MINTALDTSSSGATSFLCINKDVDKHTKKKEKGKKEKKKKRELSLPFEW